MGFKPTLERYYIFRRKRKALHAFENKFDEAVLSIADRAIFESHSIDNEDQETPFGWCNMKLSFFPNVPTSEEEFRKKVSSLKSAGFDMEITDAATAEKLMEKITEAARKDMPECDYLIDILAS